MPYFYVYLKNEKYILYISSVRNAFLDLLNITVNECNECQTTKDVLKYFPIKVDVLFAVFLDSFIYCFS